MTKKLDLGSGRQAIEVPGRRMFYTKWDKSLSVSDKFWMKVDRRNDNECWNYIGQIGSNGYGFFVDSGKTKLAHRISYQLSLGEIPSGLCVCHICDNRKCCNPKHLFLGTQADNMLDKARKGRCNPPRGERNSRTSMSSKDIINIRSLSKDGVMHKDIAKMYGVQRPCITDIVNRRSWKHVQ